MLKFATPSLAPHPLRNFAINSPTAATGTPSLGDRTSFSVKDNHLSEKGHAPVNGGNRTGHQSDWETCVVCGNNVEPGHGAVCINHHGNTVSLCNPACLRTFAHEPDPYLARLAKRMRERQMQESLTTEGQKAGQDEGFDPEPDDSIESSSKPALAPVSQRHNEGDQNDDD